MTVSFAWPPSNKDSSNKAAKDDSSHNDSFTFPPRNNGGSQQNSPQKQNLRKHHPNSSCNDIISGEVGIPRMQLFDSKAEITYIDEEDDLAARVYGDRRPATSTPRTTPKEGVSGYDFAALLKNQNGKYNSCRF
jgi:hypothetical protein